MSPSLPTGIGGLQYPIVQVSLAVMDLEATMATYHRAFGWAPWNVADHALPQHHHAELRGNPAHYVGRYVEVCAGETSFELVQPIEGQGLWSEFIAKRGEGIVSIAALVTEREHYDAVRRTFKERFGADVLWRAKIGTTVDYCYLDTQDRFGCLIEFGLVESDTDPGAESPGPARVFPHEGAAPGPAPSSGICYPGITGVSLAVRDLRSKMEAYHEAFGWGPWKVFEADGKAVLHDCELNGQKSDFFNLRWAEVQVGEITFRLIEPLGGSNPWQEQLDTVGEGITSFAIMVESDEESERVKAAFAADGVGVCASAYAGEHQWYLLDTTAGFKCLIESGSSHAFDLLQPVATYP